MLSNNNRFIPCLCAALTAMRASSVSSASTLPRKRGKTHAKAPAEAPAVGNEGDWKFIPRDEVGNAGKNQKMPVKTFVMGRKVHSCRLLLLRSFVMSAPCVAERSFAAETAGGGWAWSFLSGKARPRTKFAIITFTFKSVSSPLKLQ